MEERVCEYCGKPIEAGRSKSARYHIHCADAVQNERRRGANIGLNWYSLREFVLERDAYACQSCGQEFPDTGLHVHHRKMVIKGGTDDPANLVSLCHDCHFEAHRHK